jgi:glutaminyl-peptide cyclotransferase
LSLQPGLGHLAFCHGEARLILTNNSDSPLKRSSTWKRLVPVCTLLLAVAVVAIVLFTSTETSAAALPIISVTKVAEYPHDQNAFIQGLAIDKGRMYEGTGRYQQSTLRRVDITSGNVTEHVRLANNVFGEGLTVWKNRIIQLTWENGYLTVYDSDKLIQLGTVSYREIDTSLRQGWGITHNGQHLIISDGTAVLRFVDPKTWRVVRRLKVRKGTQSVSKLNELEFVNGEILANVWYSSRIARINPKSGRVTGWLELKHLFPQSIRHNREAVLNGIAWDDQSNRLYVTGKLWPSLFEITYEGLPKPTR